MDTHFKPEPHRTPFSKHQTQLRDCLNEWIVDSNQLHTSSIATHGIQYCQLIDMLYPLVKASDNAMESIKESVMTSVSPTGSSSSLVISLSDQLEWQQNARTHSPRTPSAPEILRSLRKSSPPTPSRWNDVLSSPNAVNEELTLGGVDILTKLVHNVKLAVVRGEFLCFRDSWTLPLGMILPLRVRIVERKEDSMDSAAVESVAPLTVGSAWLSVVAEYTYESQLASLLRARKGIYEIVIDDRRVLNRFLLGSLSLEGLRSSSLWTGSPLNVEELERGQLELSSDSGDILSMRLKKKQQFDSLEERKAMLQDQQNRLRKLLARELQRMHSVKPAALQSAPPIINTRIAPVSNQADVSNVVANMLKRFKPKEPSDPITPLTPPGSNSLLVVSTKLRGLKVEWYRVTEKLRSAVEAEQVLERKIKRLRIEEAQAAKTVSA